MMRVIGSGRQVQSAIVHRLMHAKTKFYRQPIIRNKERKKKHESGNTRALRTFTEDDDATRPWISKNLAAQLVRA